MHLQNASSATRERHGLDELADAVASFREVFPLDQQAVRDRDKAVLRAIEQGVPSETVRTITGLSEVALELALARAMYFSTPTGPLAD